MICPDFSNNNVRRHDLLFHQKLYANKNIRIYPYSDYQYMMIFPIHMLENKS